ncbi:MAG: PAS domain S-box protein [Candidatus Brocadia sp. AMX2]|uniref:histidine kinase n=1 Tax=Candidatus Brocadia sinica JPN1 TaxID=1197129 RepID=A0ABQ0K1K0_9BACT|nr:MULTISPECIES: PAS domain S-box protein [Brocadia]MBC6932570.1 PAS domain S-box protein [Candidatus Brocadia sp.]MBL1168104.1 PAS domain S-box protein [Candidatus Brocadia sp. AMX1]MCK6469864.1 PAS domain S-box protein [Candidatus Brocadia sinica]KAA0243967.1 MAG: PAS domain S-box protein [Candidatus Brocadia sp. AMX2]MCE7867016.1 PAS domain S-box protein [Candidatus Brocadia sp. AMX2]
MYISIKSRLIFLLIVFTLLPFVLLRIIAYPRVQTDLQEVLIRNLDGIGHKQTELVTNWMYERIKNVSVIAENPFITKCAQIAKEDVDYPDIVHYLEVVKNKYGYTGILVSNDKGLVTAATAEEDAGSDISHMDYFKRAVQGHTFVSGIIPSEIPLTNEFGEKELGMPTMFVSTPLRNKYGIVVGIVAIRMDVKALNDLLLSLKLGKTEETYLVSKDGYMLTESRFAQDLKDMGLIKRRCALELKLVSRETGELTNGVKQCVTGKNGFDAKGYKDYRGKTVLGVWRWLPEFKWGLITEIDKDEGYGPAYNLNYIVSSVLIILAFPIVIIAYFIGKKTSTPIVQLTEVTEKIASGDLTQRIDIQRKDEIGILAKSFNTMAISLEEKTRALSDSEKRYRELFNSVKEGVYQSEPTEDGVFISINRAGAEILGYKSPKEVIGMKVRDIYADPDDRRKVIEKLTKEGVWKSFTSLCKRKNGELFYMERTSNLVTDETGSPIHINGIFRDISERKKLEGELLESELQHRQLLKSLKEGIYQCEPSKDGVFTWINQAGAEMIGYTSPEEAIGTRVKDIYVNPDDRKELLATLEKKGVLRDFISYCKKKNGERFLSESTCNLVRDDNGKPIKILGVFRDITGK